MTADGHSTWRHPESRDTHLTAALARARQGCEQDFLSRYRQLHPALLSYLTTRLDDEETAAGAASTVWRQIAHGVFSFQGDGSDFRVWAASLAHRRTREHPQPDLAGARAGVVDDIRYVLSALPPNLADALLLRVVVGLDDAAVARVLGTTAAFVHTTVDEALRLLDDCLASRPSPGAPRAEWACAWC